jgi:hypothetical protein
MNSDHVVTTIEINTWEDYFHHILQPALRTGYAHPILKRQRVHLWACQGNGPRFASLFRDTWKRLPLWARRRILGHWRSGSDGRGNRFSLWGPTIELLDGWSCRDEGSGEPDSLRGDIACVGCAGHVLRFFAPIVDRMPDSVVCDLIAHELAHVIQYAFGARIETDKETCDRVFIFPNGDVCRPGDLEIDADDMLVAWGLEVKSIDRWTLEQGITQVRTVTPEESVASYDRFMRTGRR